MWRHFIDQGAHEYFKFRTLSGFKYVVADRK